MVINFRQELKLCCRSFILFLTKRSRFEEHLLEIKVDIGFFPLTTFRLTGKSPILYHSRQSSPLFLVDRAYGNTLLGPQDIN